MGVKVKGEDPDQSSCRMALDHTLGMEERVRERSNRGSQWQMVDRWGGHLVRQRLFVKEKQERHSIILERSSRRLSESNRDGRHTTMKVDSKISRLAREKQ